MGTATHEPCTTPSFAMAGVERKHARIALLPLKLRKQNEYRLKERQHGHEAACNCPFSVRICSREWHECSWCFLHIVQGGWGSYYATAQTVVPAAMCARLHFSQLKDCPSHCTREPLFCLCSTLAHLILLSIAGDPFLFFNTPVTCYSA